MPFVAMRASVREVLPWSYLWYEHILGGQDRLRDLRHARVCRSRIVSVTKFAVE